MKIYFSDDQVNQLIKLTGRDKSNILLDIKESYTTCLLYKNILENK